jgi:hypothetical protein
VKNSDLQSSPQTPLSFFSRYFALSAGILVRNAHENISSRPTKQLPSHPQNGSILLDFFTGAI